MELLSSETAEVGVERKTMAISAINNIITTLRFHALPFLYFGQYLQLNDAELSFFWKLWLLFVLVPSVEPTVAAPPDVGCPNDDDMVDGVVDADGALYVVNPWAVGGQ